MQIKILTLVTLCIINSCVSTVRYRCSEKSALQLFRRPAHVFSLKLLQRVAEDTDGHFVFSPLSTWMQLIALAEQTKGVAFREIWRVTRHSRNRCLQRKLLQILNKLDRDLRPERKRSNLMVVNQYMDVKPRFQRQLEKLYGIKLMQLDFDDSEYSVEQVNFNVRDSTDNVIDGTLYSEDFIASVLLLSDASYFKSEWRIPFNVAEPKLQPFLISDVDNSTGLVSMMTQIGEFNLIDFPRIKSTVLELPCATGTVSMLVFLPYPGVWPGNLFFELQNLTLGSIFNMFKMQGSKLVNVTMPKFKIWSEIDNIPEYVMDMGVRQIFYPKAADFKSISIYPEMHVSLMTQISYIEVTEKGVDAGTVPDLLGIKSDSVDFIANRPFSYMLVDKSSQFILYAGTYTQPSVI